MAEVGLRDLRRNASELVRRAEAGEPVTITVTGRPAAVLGPVAARTWRQWADLADLFDEGADSVREADRGRMDDAPADPRADG